MDLYLANRVFLVSGSSRGIGKSIAASLLSERANVCITGRDSSTLSSTEQEFHDPQRVLAVSGDLSEPDGIRSACEAVLLKWGRLDGLVANLGTGGGKSGWDQSDQEWERLLLLNLRAATRLAQAVIPLMLDREGTIVFISSIAGVEATAAPLPYSAAKAALINYSKNLARQLACNKIRVNCVAPGNILFPGGSWECHLESRSESVTQHVRTEVPMARFGKPEEIANLVAFLCSARSSFITGSCFIADGGQTRSL